MLYFCSSEREEGEDTTAKSGSVLVGSDRETLTGSIKFELTVGSAALSRTSC